MSQVAVDRWISAITLLLCGVSAVAQETRSELTDRELARELDRLIEGYQDLRSASIARVSSIDPNILSESIVLSTAEFTTTFWRASAGAEPKLFSVTHWDGDMLRSTHGPPRFIEFEPPAAFSEPPGPVQHWEVPWPLLHEWCLAIANDPASRGLRGEADLRVESDSLGMALTFGPRDECTEVDIVRDGVRTRISFADFALSEEGPWLRPREQQRTFFLGVAEGQEPRVDRWLLTDVRFNIADAHEQLTWDPDALGVYRYSPSTRNIYASDGSVLYNEQEWATRALGMSRSAGLARRLLVPGLIALALVSGAIAYWRLRR